MPISTSVITGTVAHKHELASSTGGYLAEGLTGITGGNAGEVLTATATDIPEWAAAGSSGAWTKIVSVTEGSLTATIDTGTFVSHDVMMVLYDISTDASASSGAHTSLTVNNSAVGYTSNCANSSGGAFTNAWTSGNEYRVTSSDFHNYTQNSDIGQIMVIPVSSDSLLSSGTMFRTMNATFRENSGAWSNYLNLSSGSHQSSTSVTSIQMFVTTAQIMGHLTVLGFDY